MIGGDSPAARREPYHVPFGEFVRSIHRWSASFLVVMFGLHMERVFLYGAYKYPREATWITSVVLLLLVLAFGSPDTAPL
jgi:quinol-cytochrome oxidoreductase complex cytochrome b subunit